MSICLYAHIKGAIFSPFLMCISISHIKVIDAGIENMCLRRCRSRMNCSFKI